MDFTSGDLKALFGTFSERMATERDRLCALDGVIGDADHGVAMEQGMKAAAEAAQAAEGTLRDYIQYRGQRLSQRSRRLLRTALRNRAFARRQGRGSARIDADRRVAYHHCGDARRHRPAWQGGTRPEDNARRLGDGRRRGSQWPQRRCHSRRCPPGRGSDARHDRNRRSCRASRRALARQCGPRLGLGRNAGRRNLQGDKDRLGGVPPCDQHLPAGLHSIQEALQPFTIDCIDQLSSDMTAR